MTLYDILEVSSKATDVEIKREYRRLALKHHPDHGGRETDFHRINNAYKVLSDARLRAEYDASLPRGGRPARGSGARAGGHAGGNAGRRGGGIFGPLYEEFVSKLDTEGVSLGNLDDLVDMLQRAADETKANVAEAAKTPAGYQEMISEIFGDYVTFGKGR